VAYFNFPRLNSDLLDAVMTKMSAKLFSDERTTHTPQILAKRVFRTSRRRHENVWRRKQHSDDKTGLGRRKTGHKLFETRTTTNTSALLEVQARSEA